MDRFIHFQLRFSELRDFLDLTIEELENFNDLAKREPETAFMRRLRIRVVFSCVEAHIFHLKSTAYACSVVDDRLFTQEQLLELQDLRRTPNGGLQKAKIPLKENMQLAFSAASRVFDKEYKIDFGTKEASIFFQAVAIRDRITHPKSNKDWEVSEADSRLVEQAWNWFGHHLVKVSQSV
jgi:hypothetical protein